MKRRDLRGFSNWNTPSFIGTIGGPEVFQKKVANGKEAVIAKRKEIWPKYAGPTTRDVALSNSFWASAYGHAGYCVNQNQHGMKTLMPAPRPSGSTYLLARTPEENTAMLRAVFSLVGLGPVMGVSMLDEKSQNFIWEYSGVGWTRNLSEPGNKRIVFDSYHFRILKDDY